MKCKFIQQNQKEGKCHDYYISHSEHRAGIHCRIKEWKKKKGICPYDKSIFSVPGKTKGYVKNKTQRTL